MAIRQDAKQPANPRRARALRATRITLWLCLIALALALGPAERLLAAGEPAAEPAEATPSPQKAPSPLLVCHVKLNTEVDGIMTTYLRRALETAQEKGAQLVVVEINTPGGTLGAAIDISKLLNTATVPTVAWVNTEGTSAGAMITYACDDIVVAHGGTIGDTIPITFGSSGEIVELPEKIVGYVAKKMRSNAEANGHDPDLAEAMVRTSIEIRYDDYARKMEARGIRLGIPERYRGPEEAARAAPSVTVGASHGQPSAQEYGREYIVRKGEILNLTAREALFLRVAIGRASVIDADGTGEGVERITDIPKFARFHGARVVTVSRSWSEVLSFFLSRPGVVVLLLLGAFVGIGTELKVPGFGFPGILGLTCLALLFIGQMGAGAAKWTDLILLVIGLILLAVELFVIPGFGIVGVLGIICVLAGLFMMLVPNMPEGVPPPPAQFLRAIVLLSIAIVAGGVALFLMYYFVLPHTQFLGALVLTTHQKHEAGYHASEGSVLAEPDKLIGRVGVAKSKLRPAGRAVFDGEPLDVMTQGDFIAPGAEIEIVEVKSNRIVVRERRPPQGRQPEEET
jgi:membrane-bound serine protease (ClpP class)